MKFLYKSGASMLGSGNSSGNGDSGGGGGSGGNGGGSSNVGGIDDPGRGLHSLFSAQLEPFMTQIHPKHRLIPPDTPCPPSKLSSDNRLMRPIFHRKC